MSEPPSSAQAEERLATGPDVLAINIEDETVVFHMNAGRYFGLRGAAGLIWEKIEAGTDRESAIIEEILTDCRGDADHIRADVAKTIAQMKRSGLLVCR